MGSQENWTRAQNGVRDYSCWQTPLPRTPTCFACASLGFSFACTLLVFSFACALQPVSKIRGSAPVAIHESCNDRLQGHPTDRFGKFYLFGRPLIPYDFLKRIVTSKFRNMINLMSVFFQVVKNVVLATEKRVTYNFQKGDKT